MDCPNCGDAVASGDRFCGSCGAAFDPGTAEATNVAAGYTDGAHRASRRKGLPTMRLLLVLPVLLIGGALAFWALGQGSGGSASPEAAVDKLVRAINDEDALGFLSALEPRETETLRNGYEEATDQAGKQGYIDGDTPFAGVDVTATNFKYTVTELSSDVARVQITDGNIGYRIDPSKFTGKLRESIDEDGGSLRPESESATIAELLGDREGAWQENDAAFVVAVRRDGGWYVSALYTIAEQARRGAGLAAPSFADESATAKGASSPKGVIESLFTAAGDVEPNKAIDLLDPESLRVVQDYRRAILSGLDDVDLSEVRNQFSLELGELEVATKSLDGGRTRVDIKRLVARGSATYTDEQSNYNSYTDDYDYEEVEVNQSVNVEVEGTCGTAETVIDGESDSERACLSDTGSTFGLDNFFLVVVERAGGYYLDLFGTISEYLNVVTKSSDLDKLVCDFSGTGCVGN